jgi:hypothetical protein
MQPDSQQSHAHPHPIRLQEHTVLARKCGVPAVLTHAFYEPIPSPQFIQTGDQPADDALFLAGYQALLEAYEKLTGLWIVTSQLAICLVDSVRSTVSLLEACTDNTKCLFFFSGGDPASERPHDVPYWWLFSIPQFNTFVLGYILK